jgi:NADH-quinone oxidoreductase subunit A
VSEYLPIAYLLGGTLLLLAALYAAARALTVCRSILRYHPFLSGDLPTEHAVSRFHLRWYAVTLLFLAFDMEMVFMYPWTVVLADVGVKAMAEGAVFLTVLSTGIIYAWREGGLRWV